MTATKTSPKKASRKKATAAKVPETVKLSSIYATVASRKGIDTTRAAKLVRSRLRSNFAKVCELSPNVTQHKQHANDGNRWPAEVTRELSDFLLGVSSSQS